MPLVRFATLLLAAVSALPSLPQPALEVFGLPAGEHSVGFRLLEDQDASRVVSGGVRADVRPRPIRTYVWYPAETARAQPMRFGRYAALADDDVWPDEIAGDLRRRLKFENGPLARSLSKTSYEALLARPTRAVENAGQSAGRMNTKKMMPAAAARTAATMSGRFDFCR